MSDVGILVAKRGGLMVPTREILIPRFLRFPLGERARDAVKAIMPPLPTVGFPYTGQKSVQKAGVAASPLLDSLVAYWKLDEATGATRADWTGRGNDLTDVNSNVAQQTSVKVQGNAVLFLGVQARRLVHASNSDLQLSGSDFTVAGWLRGYPDLQPNSAYLGKMAALGEREWNINANGTNFGATVSSNGSAYTDVTSSVANAVNTWYFVALIYDGSTLKIRVNETVDSISYSSGVYAGAQDFVIGGDGNGSVNGYADEWGIWKRALSDSELDLLYNGGIGTTPPF